MWQMIFRYSLCLGCVAQMFLALALLRGGTTKRKILLGAVGVSANALGYYLDVRYKTGLLEEISGGLIVIGGCCSLLSVWPPRR